MSGENELKPEAQDPRFRPERIYIQHFEQDEYGDVTELGEDTTHCQDKINETDTEYIRADLVATPPGTERVPEGVFDVVSEALEVTKLWLSANECDCDMHHVCGRPKVEKIESRLSEFLTRHRATKDPNHVP